MEAHLVSIGQPASGFASLYVALAKCDPVTCMGIDKAAFKFPAQAGKKSLNSAGIFSDLFLYFSR
jgi:hypothetical protein